MWIHLLVGGISIKTEPKLKFHHSLAKVWLYVQVFIRRMSDLGPWEEGHTIARFSIADCILTFDEYLQ